jgi:hypothetical protein
VLLIICFLVYFYPFFQSGEGWAKVRLTQTVGLCFDMDQPNKQTWKKGDGRENWKAKKRKISNMRNRRNQSRTKRGGQDGRLYTAGVLGVVALL